MSAPALAQDADAPRPRIVFQHDGRGVAGYRLYARPERGPEQRVDLGLLVPDATGTVTTPLPALPPGRYTLEVTAYNAAGESPRIRASTGFVTVDAPSAERAAPAAGPDPKTPAAPATPAAGRPSPPQSAPPPPKSRGFWGRVWGAIIGED
jgi:hypothetical protein